MNKLAAIVPTAALLCALAAAAHAEWRLDEGVAIVEPTQTNGTVELLAVMCGDPVHVELYSRGGPVLPDGDAAAKAEYFYLPGKVRAMVDGQPFPLAAGASDETVVLFAEGTKAENYMAPLRADFIEAIKSGRELTLGFDVTPASGADGSPFETTATFPLEGSRGMIDQALAGCGK
ncbi:MAG: hypothetical protein J0H53_10765 [Rhizobiales bacterium]|nr:hypothetical protein [Hyphomicrobiales bacterium]OJU33350.1 MAG: hypothetical protein BGN94_23605 [Rhizobiales bacterium 68-8]